jgi:hypothetical protein
VRAGTYRDKLSESNTAPCFKCPTGRSSSQPGAASIADCDVCAPGYGSAPDAGTACGQQCGGSAATYGNNGRYLSAPICKACPTPSGYPFWFQNERQLWAPAAVARLGATSARECLAEFAQFDYMAWRMGGNATMEAVPAAVTFEACVAACTGGCQYVTFDYATGVCERKMTVPTTDRWVFRSTVPRDSQPLSFLMRLLQTLVCNLTALSCLPRLRHRLLSSRVRRHYHHARSHVCVCLCVIHIRVCHVSVCTTCCCCLLFAAKCWHTRLFYLALPSLAHCS